MKYLLTKRIAVNVAFFIIPFSGFGGHDPSDKSNTVDL